MLFDSKELAEIVSASCQSADREQYLAEMRAAVQQYEDLDDEVEKVTHRHQDKHGPRVGLVVADQDPWCQALRGARTEARERTAMYALCALASQPKPVEDGAR